MSEPMAPDAELAARYAEVITAGPEVLVRMYVGPDALINFQAEANDLAQLGYRPVSQAWIPAEWTGFQVLIAVATIIIFIGILLVAYMLVARPPGTLTVTYVRLAGA